jgi:dolichyl-phosphate-mannose-protein mannosyltransferase
MLSARARLQEPGVLLGLIVVVGLGLRLVDAGTRLSHDEGYSWLVASAGGPSAFLTRLAHYENTPPLFYLLLAPLPLRSELWLRLPSIVSGVAMIPILYAVVRPLLSVRAGLLAALGLAVAPFAVSYSDYSRGFMAAGLGILIALLAAQRLADGGSRRWWLVYAVAGVWALYSEYYAGLYLVAIVVALLMIRFPRPREVIVWGLAPLAALLPWIPELVRSQNDLGKTKLPFVATAPTPGVVRDAIVPLVFGEHGVAKSSSLRDAQALAVLAVLGTACVVLRRRAGDRAFWLIAGVMLIAAVLQLVVTALDTNIFRQRYLTALIPLGAAAIAGAVSTLSWRYAARAVAAGLLVLGVAIAVRRAGHEYEPDSPAAVALARAHGHTTILTNSADVAFYGRRLHVVLDRPFGMGSGIERTCAPGCAVIDDARFGGVRPGPGPRLALGPIIVRFPTRVAR